MGFYCICKCQATEVFTYGFESYHGKISADFKTGMARSVEDYALNKMMSTAQHASLSGVMTQTIK